MDATLQLALTAEAIKERLEVAEVRLPRRR
jgi:hypothetical protein